MISIYELPDDEADALQGLREQDAALRKRIGEVNELRREAEAERAAAERLSASELLAGTHTKRVIGAEVAAIEAELALRRDLLAFAEAGHKATDALRREAYGEAERLAAELREKLLALGFADETATTQFAGRHPKVRTLRNRASYDLGTSKSDAVNGQRREHAEAIKSLEGRLEAARQKLLRSITDEVVAPVPEPVVSGGFEPAKPLYPLGGASAWADENGFLRDQPVPEGAERVSSSGYNPGRGPAIGVG